MLRSLVGSEMCIRDSLDGVGRTGLSLDHRRVIERYAQVPVVRFSGMFQHCLLYTSDAADDLLCVDLGGRRIIKKKNKISSDEKQIKH